MRLPFSLFKSYVKGGKSGIPLNWRPLKRQCAVYCEKCPKISLEMHMSEKKESLSCSSSTRDSLFSFIRSHLTPFFRILKPKKKIRKKKLTHKYTHFLRHIQFNNKDRISQAHKFVFIRTKYAKQKYAQHFCPFFPSSKRVSMIFIKPYISPHSALRFFLFFICQLPFFPN